MVVLGAVVPPWVSVWAKAAVAASSDKPAPAASRWSEVIMTKIPQ
jgi:hypothetical protein